SGAADLRRCAGAANSFSPLPSVVQTIKAANQDSKIGAGEKCGLATASSVSNDFAFNGTLVMHSGPLDLTGGGDLAGTVLVQAGAEINFLAGTFALNDGLVFNGLGVGNIGGGADDANLEVKEGMTETKETWNLREKGTISGTGTLIVSKEMNWTGGAMKDAGVTRIDEGAKLNITGADVVKTLDARTLENAGTVELRGDNGHLKVYNEATIKNLAMRTFTLFDKTSILQGGGLPSTFINEGGFKKDGAGVAESKVELNFTNIAVVDNVRVGSELQFHGQFLFADGQVGGAGDVHYFGNVDWRNGKLIDESPTVSTARTEFKGGITVTFSTAGNKEISNRIVTNNATIDWSAGGFLLQHHALFENAGSFNINGDLTVEVHDQARFDNLVSGRVSKTQGTLSAVIKLVIDPIVVLPGPTSGIFNNAGTVQILTVGGIAQGTLVIQTRGEHTGLFDAPAGAVIRFDGRPGRALIAFPPVNTFKQSALAGASPPSLNGNGLYIVENQMEIRLDQVLLNPTNFELFGAVENEMSLGGGVVTGTGANSILSPRNMEWLEGTVRDNVTLQILKDSQLEFFGTGDMKLSNAKLINRGTVTWTAGDIQVAAGATITTDGADGQGLFDIKTDSRIRNTDNLAGKFFVTNQGIVRKSLSPGGNQVTNIEMDAEFTNGGMREQLDGTIKFRNDP
ncbi:MAG: hypothetical protein JNM56_37270, partial [Planctomycetia bacterium]|nr:hypothetical protein [Planctomycetia bacterium]